MLTGPLYRRNSWCALLRADISNSALVLGMMMRTFLVTACVVVLSVVCCADIGSRALASDHKSSKLIPNIRGLFKCTVRKSIVSTTFALRGGKDSDGKEAKKKDSKKKSKKPKLIEPDTDEDDMDDDDVDAAEETGAQLQMMSSIGDMWTKTPPMTRVYVGSSILLTFLMFALNKNTWPDALNLEWKKVLMGQIWRPITSFLFFGPLGLNYILTIHFVWTYMAQMEKLNYKAPEDFFVLLVFGSVTLIALYTLLGLSTKFLGHNLSTYLVYIWARIFEGTDVNVMDLFLLRAEVLPWFFCAQTLILEGEIPFADLLGIVVGHLYHYLSKRKVLVAPEVVKSLFASEAMKQTYAKFKDDFEVM
jgi:Derlin-2/3